MTFCGKHCCLVHWASVIIFTAFCWLKLNRCLGVQLAQQDTDLMTDFEKKRLEAKERSRMSKEKGNNLAKLMTFKKRLATGQGTSHAALVSKVMPDGKKQRITSKVTAKTISVIADYMLNLAKLAKPAFDAWLTIIQVMIRAWNDSDYLVPQNGNLPDVCLR